MAESPTVSDDDVALGQVACGAPSPRPNEIRIESGADSGVRIPFWAPGKGDGIRADAAAAGKGYFAMYTASPMAGLAG